VNLQGNHRGFVISDSLYGT